MSTIDIFSRIELPTDKVFDCLLKPNTISRCISPFFKLENLFCKNSNIDLDTYFVQKCSLLDILQFFYKVKEIKENEKIIFEFNGLIKGLHSIYLLSDGNNCILREKVEFSLYNQFNLPIIDILLSTFFYLDSLIKQLRLKNYLYRENKLNTLGILTNPSKISSYIIIDSDISAIKYFLEDIKKLSLWLSPLFDIEPKNGNEFTLKLFLPIFPNLECKITKNNSNKVEISFSSPFLNGKNSWLVLPCEKELVIENTIEVIKIEPLLKLIWLVLSQTLLRSELQNWNKRLKEMVERSSTYKHIDSVLSYT